MRTLRMTLEYDGTNYVGWQRQKNGISVQQRVEEALSAHLGERITVTAAGRTDSGVHALGQVISFTTGSQLEAHAIQRGAFPHLPRDIAIVEGNVAPPGFDARRDARLRWYRYFILNRPVAPAVGARYCAHVRFRLDDHKMREACAAFEGHHDFSAFRASTCTAVRTKLTMLRPEITRLPNDLLMLDFKCRSFLQNMVRILAGAIVSAGRGRLSVNEIHEMLASGKRRNEAATLPPNGLFLYRVLYESEHEHGR